ncbi:hypothetical protein L210DRAFT_2071825 [Boletus edulis BED1]|uniref:Uncharacterized protein n=1 Tax=Boletus edulis BED1 TaxID=1328754 RepID=A0AAD4GGJ7_BOLED|nr:hypothetical protein L210DRAFT_2071825 [Boletus edulis BED1]
MSPTFLDSPPSLPIKAYTYDHSPGDSCDSKVSDKGPIYPSTPPPSLRALSEDIDSKYDDEEGASVPRPAPPWLLHNTRRSSLESTIHGHPPLSYDDSCSSTIEC